MGYRGRPNVSEEMRKYAEKYIIEKSQYSPTILPDTPQDKIFPLIIISSIRNDLYDENLDSTDQRFYIGYEVEIYAMNKIQEDNGEIIAKQTITNELSQLVYDVFFEHYGMNVKEDHQIPNVDTDVHRWHMKFEAKIDENKKIYRR